MSRKRERQETLARIEDRLDPYEAWRYAVEHHWFDEADAMYERMRAWKSERDWKMFYGDAARPPIG